MFCVAPQASSTSQMVPATIKAHTRMNMATMPAITRNAITLAMSASTRARKTAII